MENEPANKRLKKTTTTLFLVRHGDRWDFANMDAWKSAAEKHGFNAYDPPLSALGHQQAREAANFLRSEDIDLILVSPYLRVLQTAQPLAHAVSLPINIEAGLAETHHHVDAIPSPSERFPFFPEVDVDYHPLMERASLLVDENGVEPFPSGYLQRMLNMASLLPERLSGKNIVCFSHAASVALVAALTGKSLLEVGCFAPAGVFKLVSHDGQSWLLEAHGENNRGHITENNPKTFPWGWKHATRSDGFSNTTGGDEGDAAFFESVWNKIKTGEEFPK